MSIKMCTDCFGLFKDFSLNICPNFCCDGKLTDVDEDIAPFISNINKELKRLMIPVTTKFSCGGHAFNSLQTYVIFGIDYNIIDKEAKGSLEFCKQQYNRFKDIISIIYSSFKEQAIKNSVTIYNNIDIKCDDELMTVNITSKVCDDILLYNSKEHDNIEFNDMYIMNNMSFKFLLCDIYNTLSNLSIKNEV